MSIHETRAPTVPLTSYDNKRSSHLNNVFLRILLFIISQNKCSLSLTVKYQISTYLDYRHQLISTTVAIKQCKAYCKLKFLLTISRFAFYKLKDKFSIVVKERKNSIFIYFIRESNSDSQQFLIIQKQTSAIINLKQNSFFVLTYPINVKYGKMKDRRHNYLLKRSAFDNTACKIM